MARARSRRICYLTGTRADFGLMRRTLLEIARAPGLEPELIVTGMHLSPEYGMTIAEVERSGLPIAAKLDMLMARDNGAALGCGVGFLTAALSQAFENRRPDVLLLLGDRGEMLAGAVAAAYMNIPIAHVHGGEVSGNTDDSVRHAITKLAHLHFAATQASAERLRRMGEAGSNVFVVGAPGLDDILLEPVHPQAEIGPRYGLDPRAPYLLVVQHPVIQEMRESAVQMKATLEALEEVDMPCVIFEPNADSGRSEMARLLERFRNKPSFHIHKNLPRRDYLSLMAGAKALVGNSSSGIIEAPSFAVPVVNIGSRQQGRQRGANVIDVPHDRGAIVQAINKALGDRAFLARVGSEGNPYGDGKTGRRIARLLKSVKLGPELLQKRMAY